MKNEQSLEADGTLTATLRAMGHRLDPVPDEVTAVAAAAFSSRTIDKELASLTYDSLVDDAPSSVGAPGQARHLTFVASGVSVEIDVDVDGLRGRLVPPTAADVELRGPGAGARVVADESGRFSVPAVPTGPVSLRCQRAPADASSPLVTDWVTL